MTAAQSHARSVRMVSVMCCDVRLLMRILGADASLRRLVLRQSRAVVFASGMKFKSRYVRALKLGARKALDYLSPDYRLGLQSYSQSGEDLVLWDFYQDFSRVNYKGSYVDVGCHHPFRFSNTCIFYQAGWSGLNIDPDRRAIAEFKRFRPRDINLEMAVSDKSEPVVFNVFNDGAINSLDAHLAEARDGQHDWKIMEKRTLTPRTLASILDEHWEAGRVIDFLDVDVEGFDYEVLVSNDWSKYRPRFVLVEDDPELGLARASESRIHGLLAGVGYKLVAATLRTRIFENGK